MNDAIPPPAPPWQPAPPPTGTAAEAAVLGAALHATPIAAAITGSLEPDDFHRPAHRTLYETIAALLDDGQPVDLVTVTDRLATTGHLDEIGGPAALAQLHYDVPVPQHWHTYVAIVRRESDRRRQIRTHLQALRDLGVTVEAS